MEKLSDKDLKRIEKEIVDHESTRNIKMNKLEYLDTSFVKGIIKKYKNHSMIKNSYELYGLDELAWQDVYQKGICIKKKKT